MKKKAFKLFIFLVSVIKDIINDSLMKVNPVKYFMFLVNDKRPRAVCFIEYILFYSIAILL